MFSQFFVLTLYMQQVLHYSALKTGLAYVVFTLSVVAFSGVAQALVGRVGVRRVLPVGMALVAIALALDTRLPVHGHYFWDIFPAFLIGGTGLALVFVPMSIGALAGIRPADAGVASGLLNTNQQIGGAIGVAVTTTVATTFTSHYVDGHAGVGAFAPAALTHGFQVAFVVLAAIAAATAVIAAVFVESTPKAAEDDEAVVELAPALGEAA
jgi:MFS family permease